MITRYHRPATIGEALELLLEDGAFVMGGGTSINGNPRSAGSDAVDVQAIGITGIEAEGDHVHIGAMTSLQEIVDSPLTPPVIADAARREAPNTIRNAATLGGTIGVNDHESELLAGLLAFTARVSVTTSGASVQYQLDEILSDPGLISQAIMTRISIERDGAASADRTGRTPMDQPIVAVVGRQNRDGEDRIAIAGVDSTVVMVEPDETDDLNPPGDFRGSSEYRRYLAGVLTDRVLAEIAVDVARGDA